jgi:hypothetical protein
MQESLVNVQPALISDDQSPELIEPCQGALNYPSMPAQPLATLYSSSGNPRSNASLPQVVPASSEIVPFVSMQSRWSSPSTPSSSTQPFRLSDRLDSIYDLDKHLAIMNISSGTDYGEGYSFGFDHNMALRARFALICGVRPDTLPPFLAATVALSTEARVQSILPASPSLSSSTSWRRFHTPASCHSLRRRQQVLPLPQPISGGRYDQGKPVFSTKMIPVSAARLDTLGRPPFGLAGSEGNSGSITFQSSSVSNGLAMC